MATEFNTGSDASLNEAVKSRYEANSDTNAFTDTEKSKLAGVANSATANPDALDNVAEDASPQLGGDLDVDGNSIVSTSNGDITIAPNGTGDVVLGNYTLDADATVGASQDNHVLTYDHSTGKWGPEASAGGGGAVDSVAGKTGTVVLAAGDIASGTFADARISASSVRQHMQGVQVFMFDAGANASAARPTTISGLTVASTDVVIWVNHTAAIPTNLGTNDIAAGLGAGVAYVNDQSGTTYTLVLGDAGYAVDMSNASANTVTIPTNASVAFPVGSTITINQLGAGTTTIEGDTGVTLNGTSGGSVDINNQYSGCVIRKTATNTWIAQGDIT